MGKIHSKNLLPARWKFCTETKLLEYDIPDPRHDLKSQFWTCKIMFANLTYWIFLGRTSEQEVIPCTVFDRKLSNAFQWKWSQKGKVSCWIFQTGSIWRLQFAICKCTNHKVSCCQYWLMTVSKSHVQILPTYANFSKTHLRMVGMVRMVCNLCKVCAIKHNQVMHKFISCWAVS